MIEPTPYALRVVASSRLLSAHERFDRLVHAIAQLPDDVRLEIGGDGQARASLELLAASYGLGERVLFTPRRPSSDRAIIVYPSRANVANALLGPDEAVAGSAIVFDPHGTHLHPCKTVRTGGELVETLASSGPRPASCRFDDGILAGERISVVSTLPVAYRIPLFNRIAQRLEAAGASFRVFFLAGSARNRPWIRPAEPISFDHETLRSIELPIRERRVAVPLNLDTRLLAFRPTLVISVGFSPVVAGRVALYARLTGASFGIWSGETPTTAHAQSAVRRWQRRRLARTARFGLAYGSGGIEYLYDLRPTLPTVNARNSSPIGHAGPRKTARGREAPVRLLCVGDLASSRKGIDVAIAAVCSRPELNVKLTIVGGGRLYESFSPITRAEHRITFTGAVLPGQMSAVYEESEIFLFPSRLDIFGLALVEAMGAGLAPITAHCPGAVADLCIDGHNCLVVEGHDPEAWGAAIDRLVFDPELRARIADKARRTIVDRWTIEHSADAWVAAMRLGVRRRGGVRR